jgi:hypothetical protein
VSIRFTLFKPIVLVVLLAAMLASYALGFVRGKSAGEEFAARVMDGVSAGIRAESLEVMNKALLDLRQSKPEEARATLDHFATLQALAVADCAKAAECAAFATRPLPGASELNGLTRQR